MNLLDKNILIVGGATGIGRASADLCVQYGANIVLADLVKPDQWNGHFFQVDITNEDSVKKLMGDVLNLFNHLDVLIQTAGILKGQYVPLDDLDAEIFRQVWDVNVTGSFLCVKHAAPLLRRSKKGVIILFSSGAATGGSSSLAYGSSKAGINGFFITLANRMAIENTRVNVVSPGNIDTPMKRSVIAVEAEKRNEPLETTVQESNLGTAEGVARVVAWLASEEADYVRGIITTR